MIEIKHPHPNDPGYAAIADAVDLAMLTGSEGVAAPRYTERSSSDPRGITPDGATGAWGGSCGAAFGVVGCGCAPNGRSVGDDGCTTPNPVLSTEAEKAESEAEDNMLRMIHRMC